MKEREEYASIIPDALLDEIEAGLETNGYEVTGEKTLEQGITEIHYGEDGYYCGLCGCHMPIDHFPH